MFQSIKGAGGSWAGAGIALGASLLIGWTLGLDWPVDREVVQTVIMVTLTVGILAFLLHRRGQSHHPPYSWSDLGEVPTNHGRSPLFSGGVGFVCLGNHAVVERFLTSSASSSGSGS